MEAVLSSVRLILVYRFTRHVAQKCVCARYKEGNRFMKRSVRVWCWLFGCLVVWLVGCWRNNLQWVRSSSFSRFLDHTQRRTTVGRTSLDEWSACHRDLYLTTHNTHNRQTFMPPSGIRTHNLSKRAAADLRLRPHGHWDRPCIVLALLIPYTVRAATTASSFLVSEWLFRLCQQKSFGSCSFM